MAITLAGQDRKDICVPFDLAEIRAHLVVERPIAKPEDFEFRLQQAATQQVIGAPVSGFPFSKNAPTTVIDP